MTFCLLFVILLFFLFVYYYSYSLFYLVFDISSEGRTNITSSLISGINGHKCAFDAQNRLYVDPVESIILRTVCLVYYNSQNDCNSRPNPNRDFLFSRQLAY